MEKKNNQLPFHEQVRLSMDGRKNKWLHEKTGIPQSEISRILSGKLIPSDKQVEKIRAALPVLQKV